MKAFSVLCFGFLLGTLTQAGEISQSHERLLVASKQQQTLRRQLVDGVSFSSETVCHIEFVGKPAKSLASKQTYAFSYPCITEEVSSNLVDNVRRNSGAVTAVNNHYAFTIEKTSPNSSYTVKDISVDNPKAAILGGANEALYDLSLDELYLHRRVPVLDIEGIPVDRFFAMDSVVVDSVKNDEKMRMAVTFHGNAQTPTGPDRVVGGTVWLWPDKSYAVAEYDVQTVTGVKPEVSRLHRVVEWGDVNGFPVPVSVVDNFSSDPKHELPGVETRWQFNDWTRERNENGRFLLSHYGLPEPGMPPPTSSGSNRWIIWLNLAGILLLAAGIAIYQRSKSRLRRNKGNSHNITGMADMYHPTATPLIVAGVLLISVGQYRTWFGVGRGTEVLELQETSEDSSTSKKLAQNEILSIKRAESQAHPNGAVGHKMVRVLLENHLSQPVTIIGGTSGCAPAGCWMAELDNPVLIKSGQLEWISFDVEWKTNSATSLPADLFISTYLNARIPLKISSKSVTLWHTTTPIVNKGLE